MASLLSWLGNEIKGGLQTVRRDVVQPAQRVFAQPAQAAQVARQTIQNPAPAALPRQGQPGFGVVRPGAVVQNQPAPRPTIPNLVNKALQTVANIEQAPFKPTVDAYHALYNYGKADVNYLRGNQAAGDKATQQGNSVLNTGFDTARQFVTKPAVQIATSFEPRQVTTTPKNPISRAILGDAPIENFQKGVISTYESHPNLPTWQRAALAEGYGMGQVAQDLPVATSVVKGISKVADASAPAIRDAAAATKQHLPNESGAIGKNAKDAPLSKKPSTPGQADPLAAPEQEALKNKSADELPFTTKPSGHDSKVMMMSPDEYIQKALADEIKRGYNPEAHPEAIKRATKYAEAMKNGDKFPMPSLNGVTDATTGKFYTSQDGFHRAFAAKLNGEKQIPVEIRKGSDLYNQAHTEARPTAPVKPTTPQLPRSVSPNAEQRVFAQNPMNPSRAAVEPPQSSPVHVGPVAESRIQSLDKLEAQGARASLPSPENSQSPLPIYNTKNVPLRDKAFRSTRSIIERQGEHGKQLAGMLQSARDTEEIYQAQIAKQLPTVRSLKGKAFENFVNATQGIEKAASPKVEQAVREWQAVHPAIRDRAVAAGLDVGDLGPTYYPHFIDYEKVFKNKNTYNQAINHLVQTGQAATQEDAVKLLGYARDTSRNRSFGNLEAQRLIDLPFYDKTPNSLVSYLSGSTKRIAQTETFGKQDEKALQLITKAGAQGYDTQAIKDAYDIAVGAKRYNQNATKASNILRGYQSTTRLGLGALTNATQNINTGIVAGHLRTMGAMIKQLSPATRSFVADTGTISDAVLNDLKTQAGYVGKGLSKITAPGFASVEKFNRSVAATAGRDYALRLAQKGDEATLRRLGVTGEIKDRTLTASQQVQAARRVVEKTQFKVDPQDLPGWADSPGGKLVSQFRTFSYAQGKFFSNEILKPAARGNLMPLGRLLASLPVGYAMYEAKRKIAGRPEEPSIARRGIEAFGNTGGAGLTIDIFRGLVPLNGKYLTPDRFTSMAAGTLGGPTIGGIVDATGGIVQAIQKKNLPANPSDLNGKAAIVHGNGYYDATTAARFGLRQIPVVGTAIQNRVLPYAPKSTLTKSQQEQMSALPKNEQAAFQKKAEALNQQKAQGRQQTNLQAYKDSKNGVTKPKPVSSTSDQIKLGAKQPTKGIYTVKGKDGSTKYATLQGANLKTYKSLDEAKAAQAKNIFKYSKQTTTTINNEMYHKSTSGTVVKGAPPAPHTASTATVYDPKTNTWMKTSPTTGKVTKIDASGAQTVVNPGIGRISNARPDYVTNIRASAQKYGVDANAALAVASAEGLGGGVGDNGTSFGPFQLHEGGALPAGKNQAWAESPAGIDYAMQQIAKVTKGKTGPAAVEAIVNAFEKPANPSGEIGNALAVYNGTPIHLSAGAARSGKISGTYATTNGKTVKVASSSRSAKGASLSSLNSLLKAASGVKGLSAPKAPTVTPPTFKRSTLKRYAVQGNTVQRTKISPRRIA